jgi:hypothetical protein
MQPARQQAHSPLLPVQAVRQALDPSHPQAAAQPQPNCAYLTVESPQFSGDPQASPTNRHTWRERVVATTNNVPRGSNRGVEGGWSSPNGTEHWSKPVHGERAKEIAFKVGNGALQVAIRFVEPTSDGCHGLPVTVHTPTGSVAFS